MIWCLKTQHTLGYVSAFPSSVKACSLAIPVAGMAPGSHLSESRQDTSWAKTAGESDLHGHSEIHDENAQENDATS